LRTGWVDSHWLKAPVIWIVGCRQSSFYLYTAICFTNEINRG